MMCGFGQDLHDVPVPGYLDNFGETDQLTFIIRTYKFASFEVSCVFPPHRLKLLPVMPKAPSLPDRGFIVERFYSQHKLIVKFNRLDCNTTFFGQSYVTP